MTDRRDTERASGLDANVLNDRRRPGRINDVHPSLIPLMRNQAPMVADDVSPYVRPVNCPPSDDLSAGVGIARGVALAGVAWAVMAVVVLL